MMKSRVSITAFTFLLSLLLADLSAYAQSLTKKGYVINGYVGGFRGKPVDIDAIDAKKLTHINYAFVNCVDSMAVLTNLKTDTVNFRLLNQLKKVNPDLKILISIGGWTWSKNFSDAVLTSTSRELFARTSVDIVKDHNLDGIDIDWEYPGLRGDNNKFRPEDKQNFTLMFAEMRRQLNELSAQTGKKYLLTTAMGASKNVIAHTEMDKVAELLDYVYIMTYDFGSAGTVDHHTNLYAYGSDPNVSSTDQAIRDFIAAGVPREKLGLGAAFYGKEKIAANKAVSPVGQASAAAVPGAKSKLSEMGGGGYTNLKKNFINKNGYKRYWDKEAKAPYLYNGETGSFITYDDERSTRLKSRYVKKHKLAGVFFWEYFSDPEEHLLDVLDKELN